MTRSIDSVHLFQIQKALRLSQDEALFCEDELEDEDEYDKEYTGADADDHDNELYEDWRHSSWPANCS